MGKKKGGGKKGGGKGKKSGKASAKSIRSAISDHNKDKELDVNSKEFWMKQVSDLERQTAEYQRTCDLLEVNNGEKVTRLEQLGVEKDDIHFYLAQRLQQKSAELQELTKRLFELQQVKDQERESYETQLQSLETEYHETKVVLSAEGENLSNKLGSMKEYEVQRAELMAKFDKIEAELNRQLQEQQKVIYELERQMVVDKDRLRKEAADKVSNLATEFRKVSDKQMDDTNKRALKENLTLNKSLQRYSERTVALIEENDAYKYRAKQNRLLAEMLEFNEKELSKKFNKNLQQIRVMLDKSKGMEGLVQEYEAQSKELELAIEEHRESIVGMERVRERHDRAEEVNEQLRERIEEIQETNRQEGRTRRKLEALLLDTAKAIKLSLPPDPSKREPNTVDSNPDEESAGASSSSAGQREVLIHHLMRILNSASNMGVGPQAAEFQVEKPTVYTTIKSHTTIETNTSNVFGTRASKQYAGYRGGVLGLVPLPGSKRASATEFKTRPRDSVLSATRRSTVAGPEPVLMRSIACQTVSVPKAIFMARRKIQTDDADNKVTSVKKIEPINFHAPLRT